MCVYVSVSYVIDITIVGVSMSGPVSDSVSESVFHRILATPCEYSILLSTSSFCFKPS